jgi:hypothetical protein
MHHDNTTETLYLTIYTARNRSITLSADHLLYVNGQLAVAKSVREGDNLNNDDLVVMIELSRQRGLFVPVTWSGNIIVSGVRASVHVDSVPVLGMEYVGIPFLWLRYQLGYPVYGLTEDHPIRYYPDHVKFSLCVLTPSVTASLAIWLTHRACNQWQ